MREVYYYLNKVPPLLPKSYRKEWILGYISLCIPAAMLARVVRKIVGIKGTPLERYLMDYYFEMERRLLVSKKEEPKNSALNLQSGSLAERLQELEKEFYEDSDEFEHLKDIRGIECYAEVEDE